MRLTPRALTVACLVLAGAACAPHHSSSGPARPDRNVLSADQIQAQSWSNAYEAVEALRTNWLKPRGADSFNSPSVVIVYLDNVKYGGVETLRSIALHNIQQIRHYDANEAQARWGVGHAAGVIQVTTTLPRP
jgi:hypothetical protein